jgi:hypothetical protein
MKTNYMKKLAAMCSVALMASMAIPACTSMSPGDGESTETSFDDEHTGEAVQALSGTHKVCSGYTPGQFRDSIVVSNGWSPTTCAGWAQSIGASTWQLGCLTENGFLWGSASCGWY